MKAACVAARAVTAVAAASGAAAARAAAAGPAAAAMRCAGSAAAGAAATAAVRWPARSIAIAGSSWLPRQPRQRRLFSRQSEAATATATAATTATAIATPNLDAAATGATSNTSTCYMWGSPTERSFTFGSLLSPVSLPAPMPTPDATGVRDLAFGAHHVILLNGAGEVFTSGKGEYDELGYGKRENQVTPRRVPGLPKIVSVKCGKYHSVALSEEGQVYTWGWGGNFFQAGALGHGDRKSRASPTLVQALRGERIVQIASGSEHVIALTEKGEVFSWGNGEFGRLGLGGSASELAPTHVEALQGMGVRSISSGSSFSGAVMKDGTVWTWGRNECGQLGIDMGLALDTYSTTSVPMRVMFNFEAGSGDVEDEVHVTQLACGYRHMVALTDEGRVYVWGDRVWTKPVLVRGDHNVMLRHRFVHVGAGRNFSAIVDEFGSLFTWGRGSSNCLGHGDRASQKHPRRVAGFGPDGKFGRVLTTFAGHKHIAVVAQPSA